jgi:hypothetical protein
LEGEVVKLEGWKHAYGFAASCILGLAACSGGTSAGATVNPGGGEIDSGGGAPEAGPGPGSIVIPRMCPPQPPPSCPTKVRAESAQVSSAADAETLRGVTEIQGSLYLSFPPGLEVLSCLERVTDDVNIDFFGQIGTTSLYGLRNLKSVGGALAVTGEAIEMRADCALGRLESVGTKSRIGGIDIKGQLIFTLDLSRVKVADHIQIGATRLTRIALPSNVAFTMTRMGFDTNSQLSEIAGFENVKLTRASTNVGAGLRIVNNALLPTCRAEQLQTSFITAGFDLDSIVVSGNGPCAP